MNEIAKGSISDVSKRSGTSIAESIMDADVMVLLDVSGSMAAHDARDGKSRHSVATEELLKIQEDNPGKVFLVCFSDESKICLSGIPTPARGITNLSSALMIAQNSNGADFKIIVISDGSPHNPDNCFRLAAGITSPIYCIHIGREDDHRGIDFLKKLSSQNSGKLLASDGIGSLNSGVRFLLSG